MAPNKKHLCSCCGKPGHSIRTCPLPAAATILALRKKLREAKPSKPARPGQKAVRGPKSYGKLAAARSKAYSGDRKVIKDHKSKALREKKSHSKALEGSLSAYKELLEAGYLRKPPCRCPACSRGHLSKEPSPDPRAGRRQDLLYFRCNENGCRMRHAATSFSPIPQHITQHFSCSQLRSALVSYTASGTKAPSVTEATKHAGMGRYTMKNLFDYLRKFEAQKAQDENATITLGGEIQGIRNIEGDGTLVRKVRLGAKSKAFAAEIAEAKARMEEKNRSRAKRSGVMKRLGKSKFVSPKHYNLHIRYAALCERAGRVTVVHLPPRVVPPANPPPPEAYEEVRESGLMERMSKKAFLFCDGAHAWNRLVTDYNKRNKASVKLENVAHYKHEFTRTVRRSRRGQSKIAGTQAIDQRWRWMKEYIPHSLKGRTPTGINGAIDDYVYSWQWRSNRRAECVALWGALGTALARARRAKP